VHDITVVFPGNSNFVTTTSNDLQQDVLNLTTTTINSDTLPSAAFGQVVTFTATVAPTNSALPTPTGAVNFVDTTTGATLASNVALDSSGVASYSTGALTIGTHNIVATYLTSSYWTSTSSPLAQKIVAA